MHILFLTDNFPPEVNAPASRTYEHAREWVRAGHEVTVITGVPNFPSGKVFDGYKNRPLQRETIDGINVIRVYTYITANEGFLRRSIDYASYMASATIASPFTPRVDVVIATSPQIFTTVAGYLVSRMKRKPFVFELRDLWPESIRAVGAVNNERMLGWLERLELFLYRKADAVISVTHSFRQNLVDRGVAAEKISVVTNGADLSRFSYTEKDMALAASLGFSGKFVAGYVGTHGMAHGLETLLQTAMLLRDNGHDDVQLMLLGSGAEKNSLQHKAADLQLSNVTFVDTVPKEDVARYWALLDASIIHLKDSPLFRTVIPSKLFECMAMGIPILHGVRGESADIVKKSDVGLVFAPEDAQALYEHIITLKENNELRKRLQVNCISESKKFDRTELAANMLQKIEEVAGAGDQLA
ncbi:MAG: glycosyltransferase family 4 protein [Gammaproteobacteria bacterium]|nr:glycosyltransferase family 4 protein [Gammaproteobacteria bacterium]